jgi:hypothetical protein
MRFEDYQKEIDRRFEDHRRRIDQRLDDVSKLPEVVIERLKRDRQFAAMKVLSYITLVSLGVLVIGLIFVV